MKVKPHNISKNYYELRALYTLQALFPCEFENLIHSDKPDLFDQHNHLGIEVVRAANNSIEEYSSFFQNYLKCKSIKEIDKSKCEVFLKAGYKLLFSDDTEPKVIGYSSPAIWHSTAVLMNSISKKTKLLETYMGNCAKMALYLFTDSFMEYETDDIIELVDYIYRKQQKKDCKYSTLYVDDCGWFYKCDIPSKSIRFYQTNSILHAVCEKAKAVALQKE